jgi:MSHA pilin protein MshA
MKQQSGFTLIELVVVIVLLGILGAAATAKFQDLAGEARNAAVQGIAGEVSSGSAINYAKVAAGTTAGSSGTVATVGCDDATANALTLQGNVFGGAAKYSVTGGNCAGIGTTQNCTITDNADNAYTAVASLICTQ